MKKSFPWKPPHFFLEKLCLFSRWGPLPPGSWFGNYPTRKPGGCFLQSTWHPSKFCALRVHSWKNAPPLNLCVMGKISREAKSQCKIQCTFYFGFLYRKRVRTRQIMCAHQKCAPRGAAHFVGAGLYTRREEAERNVYIYICIYIYIYIYIRLVRAVCVYTHIYLRTHIYLYTHIYMYIWCSVLQCLT